MPEEQSSVHSRPHEGVRVPDHRRGQPADVAIFRDDRRSAAAGSGPISDDFTRGRPPDIWATALHRCREVVEPMFSPNRELKCLWTALYGC